MEYSKGVFRGMSGFGPKQFISNPTPNLHQAVVRPGIGYETKSFGDRTGAEKTMAEIIQSGLPNLSSDDKAKLASLVTDGHYKIINQEKGNKKSHSYMASPLPEGTSWSHIKIVIEKVDKKNLLHSKISIFVRGEFVIHTDFHEMFLENKVEEDISVQGKILLFMALGSRFAWEEPVIPNGQKVAKARLASSLGNFFKIDRFFDPFIKKGNEYVPRFEISAKDKFPIQEKYPKITEKFIFDLLNDSSIFPH